MVKVCPRCQTRFIYNPHTRDFIHECGNTTASEVLRNDDVVVAGDWSDFTGSGEGRNIMMQGITNNIWGSRGWIEGGDVKTRTSRGNDTETHRTRRHEEFIELENGE